MTDSRKVPVVSVIGTIALILTVTLNAAVGVLLIQTRQSTARYATCTAEWQQQFGEAYSARVEAATAVSEAMDRVVFAVAHQDPKEFRKAVANYVALRSDQADAQKNNPLPPLPEVLCGTPEEVKQ